MMRLHHRLVTDGFGLTRMGPVKGKSTRCMHIWMWSYMLPTFAEALLRLAEQSSGNFGGLNRGGRKLLMRQE
jgi:hypothetical protein